MQGIYIMKLIYFYFNKVSFFKYDLIANCWNFSDIDPGSCAAMVRKYKQYAGGIGYGSAGVF